MKPAVIIFTFASLLITFSSNAQFYFRPGYSYSNIKSDIISTENIGRFMWGVGGRTSINEKDNLNLQAEFTFTSKGFKYAGNPDGAVISFNYFTVPVALFVKPHSFFSIEGGVELSRLISASFKSSRFDRRIGVAAMYKNWDFGLFGGIGFFEDQRVNVSFRYIYGLKKILKYPEIDNYGNIVGEIRDFQNQSIQVALRIIVIK